MTDDITRVSPAEAHRLVTSEGYTYLDVRTPEEFAEGHPAGAINVPIQLPVESGIAPNADFLRVASARFAKDARVVVGCRSGQRSLRAARALLEAGFTNVIDQRAGWAGVRSPFGELKEPGWEAAGLPKEDGAPAGASYEELLRAAT